MKVETKHVKEYILHLTEEEALFIKALCQNPYMHMVKYETGYRMMDEPEVERDMRERIFNSIV